MRMFDELHGIVRRDYEEFSGIAMERYFHAKFTEEHAYSRLGGWWDRKGDNKIDLIGENEFKGTLDFFEVKRDARRFDINQLQRKATAFFEKNPALQGREVRFGGLSLENM